MLTPRFSVDQNDEFVFVNIKLSSIRFSARNVEIVIDDNLFIFSLPPYYLRLRFPGLLLEDERVKSSFVPKEESIKIQIPKKTTGEHFDDLDLTAKLLARLNEPTAGVVSGNGAESKRPLIEEVDEGQSVPSMKDLQKEAENFNWEVEQKPAAELSAEELAGHPKYGFNNAYSDMINATLANGNDINELANPDELKPDDRITQRLIQENLKFDPEYYASDYLIAKYEPENCRIKDILGWQSPYKRLFDKYQSKLAAKPGIGHVPIEFDQAEKDHMADLPRKSYLVDDPRPIYYTIVCLLFAYCYEIRSNEGDSTVESGWSIGKLTPQLSCLDSQLLQSTNFTEKSMLRVVVLTMERRALSYPLVRNYELVKDCWNDVYYVLRCGKRGVLKAILAAREFFRFHDVYYIYCKILLDDLCSWILRDDGCNERILRNLAHALRKEAESVGKKDVVFEKIMTEDSDEMEPVSIDEIEQLAEESYRASQSAV